MTLFNASSDLRERICYSVNVVMCAIPHDHQELINSPLLGLGEHQRRRWGVCGAINPGSQSSNQALVHRETTVGGG